MAHKTWRQRAAEIIHRILKGLPENATYAEKLKAVRLAYPFGERTGHPYRSWCVAVKAILPKPDTEQQNRVRFILRKKSWTIDVKCDWCGKKHGCMLCMNAQRVLCDVLVDKQYQSLVLASQTGDTVAQMALRDWLVERGIQVEGVR